MGEGLAGPQADAIKEGEIADSAETKVGGEGAEEQRPRVQARGSLRWGKIRPKRATSAQGRGEIPWAAPCRAETAVLLNEVG